MPQQLRRVRAESDGDLVHVRGDNYTVTFNRRLAQTESIEIDGKKAFPRPSHWEIESKDGPWTPASSGGTLNIVESPIEVTVELIRPIGPEGLRVREKWVLQARYAAVTISCRNPTKQPIQITRASYRWGLDPAVLSEWRRAVPGGEPVAGRLPEGFPDAPSATLVDWRDAQGRGLLIKIGRTTAVSWGGSGFVSLGTVRHGAQRTEINVLGAARIDPLGGDGAFVEFELWPHHEGSVDPKRPVMAVHGEAIN
jgi:hypothetical protein